MGDRTQPLFSRYIGIDYSGAQTAEASLKALRVYMAEREGEPVEVPPPPSPRWYWSRREIAEWLVARLSEEPPTLVGIDHGFSFPLKYFAKHKLPRSWPVFLEDFQRHWPTDAPHTYVDFVRDGIAGTGAARTGYRRWRRLTEERTGAAKSVFHFDVQGSVAAWLRQADVDGSLSELLTPTLDAKERAIAEVEGWILGVPPVPERL